MLSRLQISLRHLVFALIIAIGISTFATFSAISIAANMDNEGINVAYMTCVGQGKTAACLPDV